MPTLFDRAAAFFQSRYKGVLHQHSDRVLRDHTGNAVKQIRFMIFYDCQHGLKQRAIAVEKLGSAWELPAIASSLHQVFLDLDSIRVLTGNPATPTGSPVDFSNMPFSGKVVIYTDESLVSTHYAIRAFGQEEVLIEIFDESLMHKTLFISYGGPDEPIVREINSALVRKGVKTWFFPNDAVPGQKLHRVMHDEVNNHDHVLLICSKHSLSRAGVLNELERVLEREAREGGSGILIPVTLDDFVYCDWKPPRPDIASQVRSRVITKIESSGPGFDSAIDKIVDVLRRRP